MEEVIELKQLSKDFNEREFLCRCGKCAYSRPGQSVINPKLIQALQFCRDKCGFPIRVVSGLRCPKRNKQVGGSSRSYHLSGSAADIQAENMGLLAMQCFAISAFQYIELNDRYIHVDVGRPRVQRIRDKRSYMGDIDAGHY